MSDTAFAIGSLLFWLDYAGVGVFAISGALVASRKRMDPIGFALIGTVTGIGGGTLRDAILGRDVFWLAQPEYIVLCVALSALVFIVAPRIEYRYPVLLWADAAGLSLFAMLGAMTTLNLGFHPVIAVVMGIMSSTFGGLIRDVLCRELPLILRQEIYATAALVGALVYVLLAPWLPSGVPELVSVLVAFAVRAVALLRGLSMPRYRPRAGREYRSDRIEPRS